MDPVHIISETIKGVRQDSSCIHIMASILQAGHPRPSIPTLGPLYLPTNPTNQSAAYLLDRKAYTQNTAVAKNRAANPE